MITKRKYPWIAKQDWANVLFLNWPVPFELIRPLVPKYFTIDMYNDTAWISIVIFQAKNSHPRFISQRLSFPSITQINIRTYVSYAESQERGVYFFNLHVNNLLMVLGANTLFHLPFRYLQTNMYQKGNIITVKGKQKHETALSLEYYPRKIHTQNGLTDFLTERYCIWNVKGKRIIKIPILHSLWDLQLVNVEIKRNKLLSKTLISLEPFALYNPYKRTKLYPYEVYEYI